MEFRVTLGQFKKNAKSYNLKGHIAFLFGHFLAIKCICHEVNMVGKVF